MIYTMTLDGGVVRRLTDLRIGEQKNLIASQADGQRILCTRTVGTNVDIFVISLR